MTLRLKVRPISEMTSEIAQNIRVVFSDIDDTMTTEGKVTERAYASMWRLREAGVPFIPVTGRPAGWCDCIARQWPVDGVIGENGALSLRGEWHTKRLLSPERRRMRKSASSRFVMPYPPGGAGSRVSKDQFGRLFDLAIDFCEELPDLGLEAAQEIKAIFERFGAIAKISSIHVNGWFGSYDKLQMVRQFAAQRLGQTLTGRRRLFCSAAIHPMMNRCFHFLRMPAVLQISMRSKIR